MSLDLVNEVKNAEAQAEALKRETASQAKQISLENQKACSALLENAKAQASALRNDAFFAADAVAKQEGESRRAQVVAQCEAITQAASAKTDSAVDIVFERIVRG